MKRIYLAGPMTGYPLYNFPAFDAAQRKWASAYWSVITPADLNRQLYMQRHGREFDPATDTAEWGDEVVHEMFWRDLEAIKNTDAIAMLQGWRKSRGANIELSVARALNKEVYDDQTMKLLEPETALQEAQRLVHGERGADYGHPIDDYTRTGRIWGAILGIGDIDPRICCLMMAGVKMSREVNLHKRDNLVDLAGYAECAHMVAEKQHDLRAIPEV